MILEQFNLTGRSALVAGGNRGLGIEMAKELAEAGASVAIAAREAAKNDEALGLIESAGNANKTARICDVTDEAQVATIVNEIHEELGSIGILVTRPASILEHRLKRFPLKISGASWMLT